MCQRVYALSSRGLYKNLFYEDECGYLITQNAAI